MFDNELIQLAIKSPLKHKYGALIITRKTKIIGKGFNNYNEYAMSSLTYKKKNKFSIHAEDMCIRSCIRLIKRRGIDIKDCQIIIGRMIDNKIYSWSPCKNCKKMIEKFKLKIKSF